MQKNKLNGKEKVMLHALATGKTPLQAATKAYNVTSKRSASVIASRVMRRQRFIKALEKAGLTDKMLAKKFVEGLSSIKPLVTKEGVSWYPDSQTQLGYLKTALKALALLNDEDMSEADQEPLIIKAIRFEDNRTVINNNSSDNRPPKQT